MTKKERAQKLFNDLANEYPDAHCELNYSNAFELLIATILSAQCTDARVNIVTEQLFKDYPSPQSFAEADIHELEEAVKTTGFYRNKAKSIKETSQRIVEEFGGKVPQTMEELLSLRGVARKTANVVLGNAFGINEGVVVDTHVGRLARRYGLTKETDPVKVEQDLKKLFPQESWTILSHLFISQGRAHCKARMFKKQTHSICVEYRKDCECMKFAGEKTEKR